MTTRRFLIVLFGLTVLAFLAVLHLADQVGSPPLARDADHDKPAVTGSLAGRQARSSTGGNDVLVPVSSGGPYHAPRGSRFIFKMMARTESLMEAPGDQEEALRIAKLGMLFTGLMAVTVLDRGDSELIVALAFRDLVLNPCSDAAPMDQKWRFRVVADLEKTTLIKMGPDGQTLGFSFPEGMPPETRNLVRTLVAEFRFVVPEPLSETWRTQEADAAGSYEAIYRQLATQGAPAKDLGLARARVSTKDSRPTSESGGEARGLLSATLGWLTRADIDEWTRSTVPIADATAEHRFRGELRLKKAEVVSIPVLLAEYGALDVSWAPISGAEEGHEAAGNLQTASWARQLEGVTVDDLVALLRTLVEQGRYDDRGVYETLEKLAWLVRLDPETLQAIKPHILNPTLSLDVRALLLAALGQAAIPEAQSYLAELLVSSAMVDELRVAAAQSLFQVESPTDEVLSAVRALLRDDTASLPVTGTSLLLLGAMADRAGPASSLHGELAALEKRATSRDLTETWLQAVANARLGEDLPQVTAYLTDDDPGIRAAAANALATTRSEATVHALGELAASDASPQVRATAVEILAASPNPAAITTVAALLQTEDDSDIRRQALIALSQQVGGPLNATIRTALQWSAQHDSHPDVRQLARTFLN